jgi:hypothetical protein
MEKLRVPLKDLLSRLLFLSFFFLHKIFYLLPQSIHRIFSYYDSINLQMVIVFYLILIFQYLFLQIIFSFVLNFDLNLLILIIKSNLLIVMKNSKIWELIFVFASIFILTLYDFSSSSFLIVVP